MKVIGNAELVASGFKSAAGALGSQDRLERERGARMLAEFGKEAVAPLVARLRIESNCDVLVAICSSLKKIGVEDKDSEIALLAHAEQRLGGAEYGRVRQAAADALGTVGSIGCAGRLYRAAENEPDPRASNAMVYSAERIAGRRRMG